MINKLKIAISLVILFAYLIKDSPGKSLDNTNRPNVVPGVVVAKLRNIYQNIDLASSSALQQHPILKIERAFPQHDFSPALSRIVTIQFLKTIPPGEIASQLFQSGMFEYVEPKYVSFITETIPNDTLVSRQFYLDQVKLYSA